LPFAIVSANGVVDLPIVTQGRLEPPFRRRNPPALVARKAAQVQTLRRFFCSI
jgi:hypothetical protein